MEWRNKPGQRRRARWSPAQAREEGRLGSTDMVLVMLVVVLMAAVELFNTKKMVNGDKFDECGL